MKKSFLFIPLFFAMSCSKDIPLLQETKLSHLNLNQLVINSQAHSLDEFALKTQFGNNLEALITIQREALIQAKTAQRIAIPENPDASDIEVISAILYQEGFLDQLQMNQLALSVSNDLLTLSSILTQNELEHLIYQHAIHAIGFSISGVSNLLPCYDDYEANIALAGIAYGTCLVFSGGIPGIGLCTFFFGAAVLVIEDKFETCLQNTYPNGSSG